jgi:hypothetical protein
MKTYLNWSLKATAVVTLSLGLATLINFLLSVVFMTTFETIQLSAIWVLHGLIAFALILAAAENDINNNK